MERGTQSQVAKVCWKIRTGALEVVRLAGGERGKSNYISNIISQRDAEWQAALDYLEGLWPKKSIRDVCEAMPNPQAFTMSPKRAVWNAVEAPNLTDTEARAFLVVAKEFAAGNEELRRRL